LVLLLAFASPALAQEVQKPESVVEKMVFKFTRGIANVVTSPMEIPKQSYLTVRDRGAIGYLIGPLKGIMMTSYRAVIGGVETVFFLVPQPGYYDPMVDPDYVWNGWEEKRAKSLAEMEEPAQTAPSEKKGE
jgi:putative exosortase-associated protein (TIGR04073 family)